MEFWINLGCDGFRVDMADCLIKHDNDHTVNMKIWQDFRSWLDENHPDSRDLYYDDDKYCENSDEFGDEITAALSTVPDDFRAIVVMADLQDQSYREISEKLSIPVGTVMSRLFRGRQILRQKLHDYAVSLGIIRA